MRGKPALDLAIELAVAEKDAEIERLTEENKRLRSEMAQRNADYWQRVALAGKEG